MSGRRVAVLVALALLLGAGVAALALEVLREPQRSSFDPIEFREEFDRPSESGDDKKRDRRPKERRDGRKGETQAPPSGSGDSGGSTEGAPPAPPAPPAPAGGDDDDDVDDGDD
jgi:hypothetical protein